ncbi:hypothetical protein M409DRAFT_61008 [Zasmidium cellare ATCC 36951]|uniref:F-box domain-containing protein n=1 Tax=Zasmidium cellare ATCC 36951 TaxID=1080233 RepID=A0A6A6C015_ZASCE|nr:uncharacterized protein M409DRAFT_61008 [Zasmidium cellare ATCC 36951]KAF2159182.1 hypothetical protein M409DRAFT_61008 [Zasmidium cellare ATCC 36951]
MAMQATSERPKASLLTLPYELLEQIFEHLFQRPEGPIIVKGHEILFRHHSDKARPLVGERPRAYLLPNSSNGEKSPSLYSTHPLGQVNTQLRREISTFLRTAAVDVVTRVEGFDHSHLITLLKSLPPTKLKSLTVDPDADAEHTRTLRIHLSPAYTPAWTTHLTAYLTAISALIPQDQEISTAIALLPQPEAHRPHLGVLYTLYRHWKEGMREGPAREEVRKILGVFWARVRGEGVCMTGRWKMRERDGKLDAFERDLLWLGGMWMYIAGANVRRLDIQESNFSLDLASAQRNKRHVDRQMDWMCSNVSSSHQPCTSGARNLRRQVYHRTYSFIRAEERRQHYIRSQLSPEGKSVARSRANGSLYTDHPRVRFRGGEGNNLLLQRRIVLLVGREVDSRGFEAQAPRCYNEVWATCGYLRRCFLQRSLHQSRLEVLVGRMNPRLLLGQADPRRMFEVTVGRFYLRGMSLEGMLKMQLTNQEACFMHRRPTHGNRCPTQTGGVAGGAATGNMCGKSRTLEGDQGRSEVLFMWVSLESGRDRDQVGARGSQIQPQKGRDNRQTEGVRTWAGARR